MASPSSPPQKVATHQVVPAGERIAANQDVIRYIIRQADYSSLPALAAVNRQFYEIASPRLYKSISVSWPLEHQANVGEYRMFKKMREEVKGDDDEVVKFERSVSKIEDHVRSIEMHWHEPRCNFGSMWSISTIIQSGPFSFPNVTCLSAKFGRRTGDVWRVTCNRGRSSFWNIKPTTIIMNIGSNHSYFDLDWLFLPKHSRSLLSQLVITSVIDDQKQSYSRNKSILEFNREQCRRDLDDGSSLKEIYWLLVLERTWFSVDIKDLILMDLYITLLHTNCTIYLSDWKELYLYCEYESFENPKSSSFQELFNPTKEIVKEWIDSYFKHKMLIDISDTSAVYRPGDVRLNMKKEDRKGILKRLVLLDWDDIERKDWFWVTGGREKVKDGKLEDDRYYAQSSKIHQDWAAPLP